MFLRQKMHHESLRRHVMVPQVAIVATFPHSVIVLRCGSLEGSEIPRQLLTFSSSNRKQVGVTHCLAGQFQASALVSDQGDEHDPQVFGWQEIQ